MDKKVKLIITDLDQTFLKTDKSISQYSLEVIKECKERGINIAIATARSEKAAKKYIDLIKPDIVISNGGALVKYKEQVVYKCMLSAFISDKLIKDSIINPNVGEITVETENAYYWNSDDLCKSGNDYSHAIYNDYSTPLDCPTYKITIEVFEKNTATELAAKYHECNYVTFSGGRWYRFAHKNATKIYAINELLQYLHIDLNQVAAFGDDYNDIDMLKTCGYGIAVSNAIDEVLKVATHITSSNDKDGVAKFIKENFLT
jgi:Cof subfamily protein (haloacid dehalogenase superfamily)